MEQALLQRGLDEQSADQHKVIPEEEMEGHVDEGQGHGKKSMLNKMKNKAKTLRTKVKKKMTPDHGGSHEENHSGSQENSQEATSEEEEEEDVEEHHQAGDKTDDVEKSLPGLNSFGTRQVLRDDSQSSNKEERATDETLNLKRRGINAESSEPSLGLGNSHQMQEQRGEEKPVATRFGESVPVKDIDDDGRREYKSAEDNFPTGEFNSEATKSSLGFGKIHEIRKQGEQEKPMSTRFRESIPGTDFDDYGRGDKFVEDNFQTSHENTEPGKSWNQSSSEGADRGKENFEEFGVSKDTNSPQKPREEQFQSPEGKVNDNVKERPEKTELGKSWSERASEGFGFAKGKLQGYGVFTGPKPAEKPEESQSSLGHVQDKVNQIEERKEMGSDMTSPTNTEEIEKGPSETGPGNVTEASMLAVDQTSSSDKSKDIVIEGENKENEHEGNRQQQNGEGKESQGNVSKIYSTKDAISSKLGFGGQTNQEPNVIGETKPDDQLRGEEMDIDKQSPSYTEEINTGPSETGSGHVKEASKLADELKKVLSFDKTSSNDEAKDTFMEGENKENGDEVNQQQLSGGEGKAGQGGEGKAGQSYVNKIYSAKDAISSKLGYGGQTNQEPNVIAGSKTADEIPRTATESMEETKENKENLKSTIVSKLSPGENDKAGQSNVNKIYSAKDAISSKLGYGGQTNQEPNVIAGSKTADEIPRTATESMEGTKENKENLKSTIVSKLSPGEDHKALSEVITGAVSNSAKSLKTSIGGLYGGNGKVSTTDTNTAASGINNQSTTSNPSGAGGTNTAASGINNQSTASNPSGAGGKGIVDRVTGVVGSFFGSKQGDNSKQHSASEKSEPNSKVQVEEQVPEIPKY